MNRHLRVNHHRRGDRHTRRLERALRAVPSAAGAATRTTDQAGEVPQRKKIAPIPKRGTYVPPKTPWGDPDITGDYNNSDESGIPFERPDEYAGRGIDSFTPAELAKMVEQRQQQTIERTPGLSEFPGATSPMHWFENYYAVNSRAVARHRSGGRQGAGPDRGSAAARGRAPGGAEGARTGGLVGGPKPLRSLHHARHSRLDDAGDLRQLVSHPSGARLRDDHLRDGPRHARDPAGLAAAHRGQRFVSMSAMAAATGKATRSSSRPPTSPTRRRIADRATSFAWWSASPRLVRTPWSGQ